MYVLHVVDFHANKFCTLGLTNAVADCGLLVALNMPQAGPVDADAFRLKHWQLQGSSDGLEWIVLHNHNRYAFKRRSKMSNTFGCLATLG